MWAVNQALNIDASVARNVTDSSNARFALARGRGVRQRFIDDSVPTWPPSTPTAATIVTIEENGSPMESAVMARTSTRMPGVLADLSADVGRR